MDTTLNASEHKAQAFAAAEETPKHLGKPTIPPQAWQAKPDNTLVIILADGRKIIVPLKKPKPGK